MSVELTKQYLNRGYRSRERIKAKEERIAEWRARAESISSGLKPVVVASSNKSDRVQDMAIDIADLQREIEQEIEALIDAEKEISQAINKYVTDPTLKTVLELRYLNYLRWEEIAIRLNYTFRWTMTLHFKALKEFEKNYMEAQVDRTRPPET